MLKREYFRLTILFLGLDVLQTSFLGVSADGLPFLLGSTGSRVAATACFLGHGIGGLHARLGVVADEKWRWEWREMSSRGVVREQGVQFSVKIKPKSMADISHESQSA